MDEAQTTREALGYHKRQANVANLALLAFFVILVAFTLYRVMAEWNLAQQYQTVTEYQQNLEQARNLEQELGRNQRELNFINGRDYRGLAINPRRIPRTAASWPTDASTPTPPDSRGQPPTLPRSLGDSTPRGEIGDLHQKYSPFFKDCRLEVVDGDVLVRVARPDEFIAQAQAIIALQVLRDDRDGALRSFCSPDPLATLGVLSSSDEKRLRSFQSAHTRLGSTRAAPESTAQRPQACQERRAAAKLLSDMTGEGWFPASTRSIDDYFESGSCTLSREYEDDARVALQTAESLSLPVPAKLGRPGSVYTAEQIRKTYEAIGYRLIQSDLEPLQKGPSEREIARNKDLQAQIAKQRENIEKLRSFRPLSSEDRSTRDTFSLYQLLISALFVFSALTAALTSAYISRSHSFEVVEIERFVRSPDGPSRGVNPFAKEPKQTFDLTPVRELLALLKREKEPPDSSKK
jgi:hypothetical protein